MKPFLLIGWLIACLSAAAQSEKEIREHYEQINQQITASQQQGYEGSLYCDETVVNRHGRSWPAVGTYQETVRYWYDDDPDHVPAAERNPRSVLQKVEVVTTSAARTTWQEFLFRNGKLIFYYCRQGGEVDCCETRLYFNSKGMFRSQVKAFGKELSEADLNSPAYAEFKPAPFRVQQWARGYQDKFLKSLH